MGGSILAFDGRSLVYICQGLRWVPRAPDYDMLGSSMLKTANRIPTKFLALSNVLILRWSLQMSRSLFFKYVECCMVRS